MELTENAGWEERMARVVKHAIIDRCRNGACCVDCLGRELSEDEVDRARLLFAMVDDLAAKMRLNMLKGILKYGVEDRPLEEWLECGLDDAVDVVNYWLLARAAREVEAAP